VKCSYDSYEPFLPSLLSAQFPVANIAADMPILADGFFHMFYC